MALLPDDAPWGDHAREARREGLARYVRALADLRAAQGALDAAGVGAALVKGVVLARELYPRPDLRPFADADLLVSPSRLGDALEALEAVGGVCLVKDWGLMMRLALAEIVLTLPAGTQVDLHWSLVNRPGPRQALGFRSDELLARARKTVLGHGLSTLDDVDAFVHVAWHCTHNGATRLLWLCDVELAARRIMESADELVTVAAATRTSLAVAVALDRAALVFPQGAAADLAGRLPPSWWRGLSKRCGRFLFARPPGRRSGRAVARATRQNTVSSLLALRVPLVTHEDGPSVLAENGDAGGRADYVSWVKVAGR